MVNLKLIATMTPKRIIGYNGSQPWPRLQEDLERYCQLTEGKCVLMGRATYENNVIYRNGKLFSGRNNIVLTTHNTFPRNSSSNIVFLQSFSEFLNYAERTNQSEVFVVGGARLYEQTINHPSMTELHLAEVNFNPPGNVFFPQINCEIWNTEPERILVNNIITFLKYTRKK